MPEYEKSGMAAQAVQAEYGIGVGTVTVKDGAFEENGVDFEILDTPGRVRTVVFELVHRWRPPASRGRDCRNVLAIVSGGVLSQQHMRQNLIDQFRRHEIRGDETGDGGEFDDVEDRDAGSLSGDDPADFEHPLPENSAGLGVPTAGRITPQILAPVAA